MRRKPKTAKCKNLPWKTVTGNMTDEELEAFVKAQKAELQIESKDPPSKPNMRDKRVSFGKLKSFKHHNGN